ncbi:AcrR family transcriptional regulator [Actinoplanes octamycinicus]|uniref:AcrR family transcriptional regulator n=1 Tax=Actinoplanes octamycinicus TaxID=135948 RepID=A0A7W7H0Y6_9ACTN|nr:TetR/AcrR family transcriptional regulator [Actinoplanes octamycinicus]MBB4741913.1 AcrR family transcriptional regulator [Actinoplanes octamycinicus]GIE60676.1 hypothetical protein Aoc01nite_60780 [Actinoplanes octamycinicus]
MVRSDARRNRAGILVAAREALTEDDNASMNQIAQRAGVGHGALYRNYPSREVLILDIYAEEIDTLAGVVPELLATLSPVEALRRWTLDLVAAMRKNHSLGVALSPDAHRSITEQSYGPVIAVII